MATPRKRSNPPKPFLLEDDVLYPVETLAEKFGWIEPRNVIEHLFKRGCLHIIMGNYQGAFGKDIKEFLITNRQ